MKLLADLHISPRTVLFLRSLGHDAVRVNEIMPSNSSDFQIVEHAKIEERTILTQDLDFSSIIVFSGKIKPSLISLRLHSSRIEFVNKRLSRCLHLIESDIESGSIITIENHTIRRRKLPIE
jgi:predicted nuclease of predicted toxin-antitoxin system